MFNRLRMLARLLSAISRSSGRPFANHVATSERGFLFADRWSGAVEDAARENRVRQEPRSDLEEYFNAHTVGRGIWKWRHYFDIYERHFRKFRGKHVNICEIGVYSGGSLNMWKDYFGRNCRIYGIDIEKACKAYEEDGITILIGDQADREFWAEVRQQAPPFDVVIDDGGHLPHQQIVTLEEVLPYIRPGGVYLCEDVHGKFNEYSAYVRGLADALNARVWGKWSAPQKLLQMV